MIKKALHRITILWCLYGLVRICIWVNPWVFKVWAIVLPKHDPPIADDAERTVVLWVSSIVVFAVLALAYTGVHYLANWFFNTSNKK